MKDACSVEYIDHVGIAVHDLEASLAFFREAFQLPTSEIVEMEEQGIRVTLIPVGQTRLELLAPLSADSAVGRFLEQHGEGLHHLALNVENVAESLEALGNRGLELVDKKPRQGFTGSIAFIHPRSVHGILTELVQTP